MSESGEALVRTAVRDACLGGALISAAAALLGQPALALSIAFGTLLGAINFVLLARGVGGAIDRTVAQVELTRRERGHMAEDGELEPEQVVDRPRGAGGAMRLGLLVILIAVVLWYSPMQPLGLAIGVALTLLAASFAALRQQRTG